MGSQRVGHDWVTAESSGIFLYRSHYAFVSRNGLTGPNSVVGLPNFVLSWNCQFSINVQACMLSCFSLVAQSCLTLCDPMDCSTPDLPVHHQLLESTQTHIHWVGDAIQSSHHLSSPSPAFNLSQHQSLFKWVSSLHQVAKVLEFQLQYQSFQWIFRTDFL